MDASKCIHESKTQKINFIDMKNTIFIGIFSLIATTFWGQNTKFGLAEVSSVRMYNNAAELEHQVIIEVPKGTSELVITNLADQLSENTIQVAVPKHITVMSVQFTNAYIEEYDNNKDAPQVKPIKDALEQKEAALKSLKNQIETQTKSIELLDKNQKIAESDNFTVQELTKLLSFYQTNRLQLATSVNELTKKEQELIKEIQQLKDKLTLNNNSSEKISRGKAIIQVMSTQAGKIPVKISYISYQARWRPSYDLRIDQVNAPIQLTSKAMVQQNTGVDWKNVKLTLTSGVANQSIHAPTLSPWYIGYASEVRPMAMMADTEVSEVQYVDKMRTKDVSVAKLQTSTMDDYVTTESSQLNLSYNIDVPYTILSNNKSHSVALQNIEIPATYEYVCTPKYDTSVYLTAKIKDYNQLNLLDGEAQVIFENVYVGKTYIQAQNTKDELVVSLGKDNNLSVTRTMKNEKEGNKMFSSKKEQSFNYEITARNNKRETVEIKIFDQAPISENKDIEVNITEKSRGLFHPETGEISWDIKLKPAQTEKIKFGFSVRSAKDKELYL